MNLGMTFEADRNCVFVSICSVLRLWNDVIQLYFDTAETMANTAASVARNQQLFYVFVFKLAHLNYSSEVSSGKIGFIRK